MEADYVCFLVTIPAPTRKTLPKNGDCKEAVDSMTYSRLLKSRGVLPVLALILSAWALGYAGAGTLGWTRSVSGKTSKSRCRDVAEYRSLPVNPVYWYTAVELGGWDFSTAQISLVSSLLGLVGIIYSLVLFPRISCRYGNRRLVLLGTMGLAYIYVFFVLANTLLRLDMTRTFRCLLPVWLLIQGISFPSINSEFRVGIASRPSFEWLAGLT